MLNDISIEYAHIYTNDKINEEHQFSVDILNQLTQEYSTQKISLVVLVDDYSFPDPSFNYRAFSDWLAEQGFKPGLILKESELIPSCDEVIKLINNINLRDELLVYIEKKKYPCSLFIATWYLLRLGHITSPIFDTNLVAKKVVNILPLSFKQFEDKARDIIASTPFSRALENIDNKYFEGRLIK